jgi:hypothetical protein
VIKTKLLKNQKNKVQVEGSNKRVYESCIVALLHCCIVAGFVTTVFWSHLRESLKTKKHSKYFLKNYEKSKYKIVTSK